MKSENEIYTIEKGITITISNLEFRYNESSQKLFDNFPERISFDNKYINVITGPNGSGKSTLLNLISGNITLDNDFCSGQFLYKLLDFNEENMFEKIDLLELRKKQNIGFIFQDDFLFRSLSFEDNLKMPLKFLSKKEEVPDFIEKEFSKLFLSADPKNRKVAGLSGGEEKKLSILRSIIHKPKLLLIDEPTNNIDKHSFEWFIKLLENLYNGRVTIILITHDEQLLQELRNKFNVKWINLPSPKNDDITENKKDPIGGDTFLQQADNKKQISLQTEKNRLQLLKNRFFFSLFYLGVRNKNSFFSNIIAILLSMTIIIMALSISEFFVKYEHEAIMSSDDARIIKIYTSSKKKYNRDYWENYAAGVKNKLTIHAVNQVSPVFVFQAFIKDIIRGRTEEFPVLLKSIDVESKEYKELEMIKTTDKDFNNSNCIVINESVFNIFDSLGDKIDIEIDLPIKNSFKVDFHHKYPIHSIVKKTSNNFLYISLNMMWKLINDKKVSINPSRVEVELNDIKYIDLISGELRNKGYSIENIYDVNKDLINAMKLRRKAVFTISGILIIFLLVYLTNNVKRTIDSKQKEIGYLLATYATKSKIQLIFLGNFLFSSFFAILIALPLFFIGFYFMNDNTLIFAQPPILKTIIALIVQMFITMIFCCLFLTRINKLDPIKIIQGAE